MVGGDRWVMVIGDKREEVVEAEEEKEEEDDSGKDVEEVCMSLRVWLCKVRVGLMDGGDLGLMDRGDLGLMDRGDLGLMDGMCGRLMMLTLLQEDGVVVEVS